MADPGGGTLSNVERDFSALRLNMNPFEAEAIAFFDGLLKDGKLNDETVLSHYNNILQIIDDSKSHTLYNNTPDNRSKSMEKLIKHLTYYKVLVQKIIKPFTKYPDLKPSVVINDSISNFTPIQLIAYFYSDKYKRILDYSNYRAEEATKIMNATLLSKKLPFLPIPEEMLKDNFKAYIKIHIIDTPSNVSMATPGSANHTPWKTYYTELQTQYLKVWSKYELQHINETFLSELWFMGIFLTEKFGKSYEKPDINKAFIDRVLGKLAVKARVIKELENKNIKYKSGNILYLLEYLKGKMTLGEALATLKSISGGKRKRTRKAKRKSRRCY
jgi:hypothetical protein